jgi:hypothetical protein
MFFKEGKKVKIDGDGEVFIDGNYSNYKLRKSGTRKTAFRGSYSNILKGERT